MSDAEAPVAVKKAVKAKKPRAPKKPSTHPKVQVMVINAIKDLKERNGSSLQAIKKHIESHNKGVDMLKLNFHIKKCLKNGVEKKVFVQTKGTGASGSFKLAAKAEKPAAAKPKAKKPKSTKPKAAKKPAAKKPKSPKKAAAKKPATKKTPKKAAKPKAAKKPAAKKPAAKKPVKKTPKKAAKKPTKK